MKIKKHTHHNGWVKLHRKIVQWEWWDDHNTTRLFIYLILMANREDAQWHGITIKKGQYLTSISKLAKSVGLSVRQVRVALNKLVATDVVTKSTTSIYTLVAVKNYEVYQVNDKVVTSEQKKHENGDIEGKNDEKRAKRGVKSVTSEVANKMTSEVTKSDIGYYGSPKMSDGYDNEFDDKVSDKVNDKVNDKERDKVVTTNKKNKEEKKDNVLAVSQQVLNRWNEIHKTNYTSPAAILVNLTFWLTQYSLDDIFAAIAAIARHPYWRDKDVSPAWLFRRKNPRGEPVDYIADLIAASSSPVKVDPDLMYIPEPELPEVGKENV